MANDKVIVGMSGGVDSSVAALLLTQQGYAVEGLFMKNWEEDDGTEYCTALQDLEDATRVCDQLGIPLHTANFAAEYWDNVFEAFLGEYSIGRTPNPDVLCNREIKFKQFADYATTLGADFIATGHYARTQRLGDRPILLKGLDRNKDQSYFLQAVRLNQLENVLFPVGELQKTEVREIARTQGFANHRKKDSTGICFIGERRFRDFLERYIQTNPGPMVDQEGCRVGEHAGLPYYTLGQRQGLGIGGLKGRPEAPWYVVDKRVDLNHLVVTQQASDLDNDWLATGELNWLVDAVDLPMEVAAKVRYRQADQAATVRKRADGRLLVQFATPQRAITPGQYVCLYDGEVCLGGGTIESYGSFAC